MALDPVTVAAAVRAVGIDPLRLAREGVDAVLAFLGVGQCSQGNKAKYRTLARAATDEQLLRKLRGQEPLDGSTGNCRKYYIAQIAAEATRRAAAAPAATPAAGLAPGVDHAAFARAVLAVHERQAQDRLTRIPMPTQQSAGGHGLALGALALGALAFAFKRGGRR